MIGHRRRVQAAGHPHEERHQSQIRRRWRTRCPPSSHRQLVATTRCRCRLSCTASRARLWHVSSTLTRTAALHLARQFEERRGVTKTCHALLVGTPDEHRRLIDAPIDGLPSQTEYDILDVTPHPQWGSLASVRMRPKTGRTHQLRVHAAAELGCPIVGDDLYWEAAAQIRPNLPPLRKTGGLFLQSCAVAFEHPDAEASM